MSQIPELIERTSLSTTEINNMVRLEREAPTSAQPEVAPPRSTPVPGVSAAPKAAETPMTWEEVLARPEMQSLSDAELEAARVQYFIDVVYPRVDPREVTAARRAFDADTKAMRRPGPLKRAVTALGDAIGEIRRQATGQWAGAGFPEPTAEELGRASRPARMTVTRGGQPVLQPNAPAPAEEPSADWGEVVSSLPAQAVAGTRAAAANLRRMANEESIAGREETLRPAQSDPSGWGALVKSSAIERQKGKLEADRAELAEAIADAAQATKDVRLVTPANMTTAQQALSSLAQSAGPTLLGLAAGILTRSPAVAIAIAGPGGAAQQAGATYGEARDAHGATHRQASVAAAIDAALEGGGEALPLNFALKAGTPIFKRIFGTMAREAGQEAATQFAQDLRAMSMENPKLTFGEVWHNVKVASLAGAGGGAVYGGAGAAVNAAREREDRRVSSEAAVASSEADMPAEATLPAASSASPGVESRPGTDYGQDLPPQDRTNAAQPGDAPTEDGDLHPATGVPTEPIVEPAKTGELSSGFDVVDDASKAAHALASLRKSPQERFYILALDRNDRPISVLRLFAGSLRETSVYPEVIAKAVYQTPGVAKVWFAHNHPSGTPMPSQADQTLTRNLAKLFGKGSGVDVAGQVVIAGPKFSEINAAGEFEASANIPPAARNHVIPITERVVRRPAAEGREAVTSPTAAKTVVARAAAGRSGVAFLDAQHRMLGFFPMTVDQMRLLRSAKARGGSSEARRLFEAAGRLNAGALIVYSPAGRDSIFRKAANNVATAADLAGIKPLDAIHGDVSLAEAGNFPELGEAFEMRAPSTEERPAAGIALTPPYSPPVKAQVEVDAKRARPDAIRQTIREMFGVPINESRLGKSRQALGIYKTRPRTIRVRNQNDIAVIAHELGHHLSETSQPIREARRAFDAELRQITPYAAQQRDAALRREEGMAEFVRLYLTEPAQAKARAPGFFKAFEQYVERTGLKAPIDQVAGAIRDWQNLPPADRILAKVGEAEPNPVKRFNLDRIMFEVFDRWLPLKRMVEDLKPGTAPSSDPFKLAHLLAGDAAIIEDFLLRETVPFDFQRRADPKDRGRPLAAILKPIEQQQREFGAYLIAKRANELMRRGKEHLYSRDEIAAGLKLETPEFKAAAKALYEYQDRLLDYAVEGGLLSAGAANAFRQHPFYVPFFRVGEPLARRGGSVFKEIRGGTENLRDPIANIIENTVRVIHATNRNFVLAKAHDLARSVPGGGRWLEDVPMPERAVKLETQKIIDQLREQGVEISTEAAEALAFRWQQAPVVRVFFRDRSGANSRHVTEFYEALERARRAGATLRVQPDDDARAKLRDERSSELRFLEPGDNAADAMARLRAENDRTLRRRDLSGEEKLRAVDANNARIRDLAKRMRAHADAR